MKTIMSARGNCMDLVCLGMVLLVFGLSAGMIWLLERL